MRTTTESSTPLLRKARKLAESEETTLHALVERGLRRVATEIKPSPPFNLRRASFTGYGIEAEAYGASWSRLCDLAYEGRMA